MSNISVEIINPEVLENLYYNHGVFACECYHTPTKGKIPERVGKSCQNSGHWSGSRAEYIKFRIVCDRGTEEQIHRHVIGAKYGVEDNFSEMDDIILIDEEIEKTLNVNPNDIICNMGSFRYIDKHDFEYATPKNVLKNAEAKAKYDACMDVIENTRKEVQAILIENGMDVKSAVEDANMVLPRATYTSQVVAFTPEALLNFMWKRLCTRAQEFIREVAIAMKKEVEKYNPEFAKACVPHCQHLLWCPEGDKCCGITPNRAQLIEILQEYKENHK